jgi:hypothetical protein
VRLTSNSGRRPRLLQNIWPKNNKFQNMIIGCRLDMALIVTLWRIYIYPVILRHDCAKSCYDASKCIKYTTKILCIQQST